MSPEEGLAWEVRRVREAASALPDHLPAAVDSPGAVTVPGPELAAAVTEAREAALRLGGKGTPPRGLHTFVVALDELEHRLLESLPS